MKQLHRQKKSIATIIPVFLMGVIGITAIQTPIQAYASEDCNNIFGRCYADEEYNNSNLQGNKYALTVSSLQNSACPNSQHVTTTQWVNFPNGDWIELGVTQGILDGTCNTSPHRYTAVDQNSNYVESNIGSTSSGTSETFEVSDTSGSEHWDIYNDGSNYGYYLMQTDTASSAFVGEESTDSNTVIPSTHEGSISWRLSGSWSNWNTDTTTYTQFGHNNWISECSPTYSHIHVGISSTQSCTD